MGLEYQIYGFECWLNLAFSCGVQISQISPKLFRWVRNGVKANSIGTFSFLCLDKKENVRERLYEIGEENNPLLYQIFSRPKWEENDEKKLALYSSVDNDVWKSFLPLSLSLSLLISFLSSQPPHPKISPQPNSLTQHKCWNGCSCMVDSCCLLGGNSQVLYFPIIVADIILILVGPCKLTYNHRRREIEQRWIISVWYSTGSLYTNFG